ncbi:MAG: epoxide hydrolase, partial [Rhodobiaceae bacterium]|nr:epoxide hydrolase [Rhodobiaceae bacterium]
MSTSKITPFTIDISNDVLETIRAKVAAYQWHEMPVIAEGGDRWAYG